MSAEDYNPTFRDMIEEARAKTRGRICPMRSLAKLLSIPPDTMYNYTAGRRSPPGALIEILTDIIDGNTLIVETGIEHVPARGKPVSEYRLISSDILDP